MSLTTPGGTYDWRDIDRLSAHDGEYRRAFKDWQTFVDETSQTITAADETVPELPSKDVVFRIYRDTRFSKDPTPYKVRPGAHLPPLPTIETTKKKQKLTHAKQPHFSAAWSRTGRKGPYACYYIHCEPGGQSFIGGGLWHPEAGHVQKMRRSIDRHPERWREVLDDAEFRRVFFPGVKPAQGAEAVVKAFVGKNQMGALKKKPMVSTETLKKREKGDAICLEFEREKNFWTDAVFHGLGLRCNAPGYRAAQAQELHGGRAV